MLARVVRSGVTEARHEGAVAVVTPDGVVLASHGDIDRPYYIRSSAKPFQAMAALTAGAAFEPEQLAVACASHGAQPIHVAYTRASASSGRARRVGPCSVRRIGRLPIRLGIESCAPATIDQSGSGTTVPASTPGCYGPVLRLDGRSNRIWIQTIRSRC